jgi:hypothetical protein
MTYFTTNVYSCTDRNNKFKGYNSIIKTFPNSQLITEKVYSESDLGIIYSWINEKKLPINPGPGKTEMLIFKKTVIDEQLKNNRHVMAIDNSLFVYKDQSYKHNYLRYSIDGVFANSGYYFDHEVDPKKWDTIRKKLSIDVKPWRKTGSHILICLQRNNGFSFDHENNIEEWLLKTVSEIRKFSDRRIIIRPHPGDGKTILKIRSINSRSLTRRPAPYNHLDNKVIVSTNRRIEEDLRDAWCTIVYNSSPSTVSAIEGVPVFILDPIPQRSQSFDICNTNLKTIENPIKPNRQQWLEKISMSHFTIDDIDSGMLYRAVSDFFERKQR